MTSRCLFFAVLVAVAAQVWAGSATADSVVDIAAERDAVEALLAGGDARAAIDRLKALLRTHPDEPALVRLLARAYVADDNPFWAERALAVALERDPDDWETRSWLAWVQLSQGDVELARQTLSGAPPSTGDPAHVRRLLLLAVAARSLGDQAGAIDALAAAARGATMFEEDRELWEDLWRSQPGWRAPLGLDAEVALGYTSNSTAGSPTDPGTSGNPSALARFDLFAWARARRGRALRPVVELHSRGHGVSDEDARELNYVALSLRPGVVVGRRRPVSVFVRAERMFLDRQPSTYAEGYRLEAEAVFGSLTAFAGAGHRTYVDPRRSRDELDGGAGVPVRLGIGAPVLVAGAVRSHDAEHPAYDLLGATALAAYRPHVGRRFALRVGLTLSYDDYYNSGGETGLEVFGSEERRQDLLTRAAVDLWRVWGRWSLGARYEFSHRDSTVDSSPHNNYDYKEHRAVLVLRWGGERDVGAPRVVRRPDHVSLPYELAGVGASGPDERIQDLLRRDEEVRRGSACSVGGR